MIQPFPSQSEIIQTYRQTIDQYHSAIQKLKKIKRSLSFARLIVVVLGVATCWLLPVSIFFFVAMIVFAAGFIFLVFRDADKSSTIKNHERLVEIIRHEVDAMQQELSSYED